MSDRAREEDGPGGVQPREPEASEHRSVAAAEPVVIPETVLPIDVVEARKDGKFRGYDVPVDQERIAQDVMNHVAFTGMGRFGIVTGAAISGPKVVLTTRERIAPVFGLQDTRNERLADVKDRFVGACRTALREFIDNVAGNFVQASVRERGVGLTNYFASAVERGSDRETTFLPVEINDFIYENPNTTLVGDHQSGGASRSQTEAQATREEFQRQVLENAKASMEDDLNIAQLGRFASGEITVDFVYASGQWQMVLGVKRALVSKIR